MTISTDWVYDIEMYLDLFCIDLTHVQTRTRYIFEVSERRDQSLDLVAFLQQIGAAGHRLFGFNNVGFDWPVMQHLMQIGQFTALDAHRKGTAIIKGDRFAHTVWPRDRMVTQGDLFLIHHFDNMARSTSLKKLEIAMRSLNVVDLPYPPDQPTTSAQKDEIIAYMCHDVSETLRFYHASLDQIRFRDTLAERYPDIGDVLNFNDTKIGKKFFERELERAGTQCYVRVNGRREPNQTKRDIINICDIIAPSVAFEHHEFQRVLNWLKSRSIAGDNTKGVFTDLHATIDGFTYDFGTGGIHGSVEGKAIHADDEYEVWDWDVASYYPNLAISNRLFPAHLSEKFCDIYQNVYEMRKEYKKGTAENAMLKLALNGVYGDSNNKYSVFYDPQYTMSITVNGQLLLCMLAEWLAHRGVDGIEMIQINTDGLTLRVRKDRVDYMKACCAAWEQRTGLELESAQYASMFVRDVNSYIAVGINGKIKRIGAYAYLTPHDDPYTRERQWHQNHSNLASKKAAEAHMLHGTPIKDALRANHDPFDFTLSVKVPRNCHLLHGDQRVQNTSRYYMSTEGASLTKVMPPLKGKDTERNISVESGYNVTLVNDMAAFDWSKLNWYYYINEARKLVIC